MMLTTMPRPAATFLVSLPERAIRALAALLGGTVHETFRLALPRVELAVFSAIGVLGVLVNLGCMYVAVDVVGLHYLPGKVGSAAVTFFTNFGLRRLMLFTPPASPAGEAR